MKQSVQNLAIAALVVANANAIESSQEDDTVPVEGTYGQRKMEVFRGGWTGFNRGLYKSSRGKSLSKTCLDDDTADKYDELLAVLQGQGEGDYFTMAGKFFQIGANIADCGFRKPLKDISAFCHPAEPEKLDAAMTLSKHFDESLADQMDPSSETVECNFPNFLSNISKNAFTLMGKSSEVGDAWKEYPAPELDELHEQAMILGEGIGTFLRVGLDFEQ